MNEIQKQVSEKRMFRGQRRLELFRLYRNIVLECGSEPETNSFASGGAHAATAAAAAANYYQQLVRTHHCSMQEIVSTRCCDEAL